VRRDGIARMRAINRDDRQPLIQFEINHGLSILRQ
jgi:hypothetical protein